MPSSSYATQISQIGAEVTYGVAVAANKKLNDIRIIPQPQFETDAFMPSGDVAPSLMVLNDDFTEADIEGRPTYTGIIYPFASLFGPVTPTIPGGATIARQWQYIWDGRTPVTPQSFTLEYGQAGIGKARRIAGFMFNGMSLSISRDGLDFSASGYGKRIEANRNLSTNEVQTVTITGGPTGGTFTLTFSGQTTAGINWNANAAAVESALEALSNIGVGEVDVTGGPGPTTPYLVEFRGTLGRTNVAQMTGDATGLTGGAGNAVTVTTTTAGGPPTDIAAQPIFPLHFRLYADDSWATLGTTKLLHTFTADLELGERTVRTKPINADLDSDDIVEAEDQEHTISLQMEANAVSDAFFDTIRAGTYKFFRFDATGPLIESGQNYRFQADFCILFNGHDGYDNADGVHVQTWTGMIARDTNSGNAARFTVVNNLAAY
jgi:hypothetical protein